MKLKKILILNLVAAIPLASNATVIETSVNDKNDGGVALTAHASSSEICYSNCDASGNNCKTVNSKVSVSITSLCSASGDGVASCTAIVDRGTLHGTKKFNVTASDCKGVNATDTITTTYDNTPSVIINDPNGTVHGSFNMTGKAVFTPTLNATKGTVHVYINGGSIIDSTQTCTDIICDYDYKSVTNKLYDKDQGSYSIELRASGGGATGSVTGSFDVDNTPTISLSQPNGTIYNATFNITGTAVFPPSQSDTKGSIQLFINNNSAGLPNKICKTESCSYDYSELIGHAYSSSSFDEKIIKLSAGRGSVSASDEHTIFIENYVIEKGQSGIQPNACDFPCEP